MAHPAPKESILFIFCDQMRADCLSCAGHPEVRTPHLDALAADGIRFANTITQSPVCVPARMSLFTGRYVHQHGCCDNGSALWPESPNFVRAMREAGHQTACRGKLHLFWRHDTELLMCGPLLERFGFSDGMETTGKCSQGNLRASAYTAHLQGKGLLESFWGDLIRRVQNRRGLGVTFGPSILGEDDHMDGWIMDRGLDFLRQHRADPEPWLLWVGPEGPHDPFDPPAPWSTHYDPATLDPGLRRPTEDPHALEKAAGLQVGRAPDRTIREMRAQYYGNISFIDHKVGQLVGELKQSGRYEHTWIVFASDHGEMLGDFHLAGKEVFHHQACRVPLIIKAPASLPRRPRGVTSQALVELIDVGTTLREIAGGHLPGDQGRSLLPILEGEADPHRHRPSAHAQLGEVYMIQTPARKMVFRNPANPEVLAFYDLAADPGEWHNLRDQRKDEITAFIREEIAPFFASTHETLPAPWKKFAPYASWKGRNPWFEILGQTP